MKLTITYQDAYSRGELLLRSFFGVLYIALPHSFLLFFYIIWGKLLSFIAFWTILFTGQYPKSIFDYQVKLMSWNLRLNASLMNLVDGYPSLGLNNVDENAKIEIEYPENLSRGSVLLRAVFGFFYVLIPHGFILYFRTIAVLFISFFTWFAVLFTGKYPKGAFDFIVETYRWQFRVTAYLSYLTQDYPAFNGKA